MNVQIVESFDPLRAEWDDLARRRGAPPFLRPGWFEAWWRAFGRGRPALFAGRAGGRLAAVGAFARRGGRLESMSNVHSPLFGFLAEDADAERGLARAVFASRARAVVASWLDGSAPSLTQAARHSGRVVLRMPLQHSPVLRLKSDFAAFERSLSKKFVTDLGRRRRALERSGEVVVEVLDGRSGLDALLNEAFRIESSGWKDERGTAIASRAETLRFYTEIARWSAGAGILRLAFLRLDGRPLAFEYALEDGSAWWFLKGGVDPEHRRFAPGKLLVHAMVERGFATGLERFEFLGADERWKEDWHPGHREVVIQHAFARSPLALAEAAIVIGYRAGARPLVRRTLAWAR